MYSYQEIIPVAGPKSVAYMRGRISMLCILGCWRAH